MTVDEFGHTVFVGVNEFGNWVSAGIDEFGHRVLGVIYVVGVGDYVGGVDIRGVWSGVKVEDVGKVVDERIVMVVVVYDKDLVRGLDLDLVAVAEVVRGGVLGSIDAWESGFDVSGVGRGFDGWKIGVGVIDVSKGVDDEIAGVRFSAWSDELSSWDLAGRLWPASLYDGVTSKDEIGEVIDVGVRGNVRCGSEVWRLIDIGIVDESGGVSWVYGRGYIGVSDVIEGAVVGFIGVGIEGLERLMSWDWKVGYVALGCVGISSVIEQSWSVNKVFGVSVSKCAESTKVGVSASLSEVCWVLSERRVIGEIGVGGFCGCFYSFGKGIVVDAVLGAWSKLLGKAQLDVMENVEGVEQVLRGFPLKLGDVVGVSDKIRRGWGASAFIGTSVFGIEGILRRVYEWLALKVDVGALRVMIMPNGGDVFSIKIGDSGPALKCKIVDQDGREKTYPIVSVMFRLRTLDGDVVFEKEGVWSNGELMFDWNSVNTSELEEGTYHGEFECVLSEGTVITVPNDGFIRVRVRR